MRHIAHRLLAGVGAIGAAAGIILASTGAASAATPPFGTDVPGHMSFCHDPTITARVVARSLSDENNAPPPTVATSISNANCQDVDLTNFGDSVNLEFDVQNADGSFTQIGNGLTFAGLSGGGIAATVGAGPNPIVNVTGIDGKSTRLG